MTDEFVSGLPELIATFQRLSESVQGEALGQTALAGGTVIVNAAKNNIKSQDMIKTRTLSRSIHEKLVEQSKERAVAASGTNLEYAAIHEFGGVITPKTRKYLAIPVGSMRGSPLGKDLKIRITNRGNLVMIDGNGAVQYVLKQSVLIPAQPYMRPAYDEHKDDVVDTMQRAFVQQIKKAVQ